MIKGGDSVERGLGHRIDGKTGVDGPGETVSDAVQDSAETGTETSPVEEREPEVHSIQIDQLFEILKNHRRRAVLRYLQTVEDEVKLGHLAEQIAAWECDKDVSLITSQERKRVYVGLYQCHLPKMDDVGAISYNKPRGKIQPGENIDLFEQYLPAETNETEQAWTRFHRILPFVISLLMLGFVWLVA